MANEMGSNVLPWQTATRAVGGHVLVAQQPEDWDWAQALVERIREHEDTLACVALSHVHWCDGSYVDLETVAAECHSRNIPIVCDVTQSAGAVPISVQELKPAFLMASVHKWLLGCARFPSPPASRGMTRAQAPRVFALVCSPGLGGAMPAPGEPRAQSRWRGPCRVGHSRRDEE
jgi:hypothetical protein